MAGLRVLGGCGGGVGCLFPDATVACDAVLLRRISAVVVATVDVEQCQNKRHCL